MVALLRFITVCCGGFLLLGAKTSTYVWAQTLHERIDMVAGQPATPLSAPLSEDSLFLRRLSLDLRNVVPTDSELREYLADATEGKREVWIDRFLQDPWFQEKLVTWLDLSIMERRAAQHVDRQQWIDWLRGQVDKPVPLDLLVQEIVGSQWWNRDNRPAQRFFLDRGGDSNLIARDFGRIFLGRDLQCAQCHDHPLIDDYLQQDYHGLLAFFSPSSLAEVTYKDSEAKDQKLQLYVEKSGNDGAFESVFDKGVRHWIGPKLPERLPAWESYLPPHERYQGAAADWVTTNSPERPIHSRRQTLAETVASADYRPFAENWANRLWAIMFGSGLVQPLDMHHADNPPSNPELFEVLTNGLIELRFDPKSFLREIALSQTYQKSHWLPIELSPELIDSLQPSSVLNQQAEIDEKLTSVTDQSSASEKAWQAQIDALAELESQHVGLRAEIATVDAQLVEAHKKATEAKAAEVLAGKTLADTQTRQALLAEAATRLEQVKSLIVAEDAELATALQTTLARRDAAINEIPNLEAGFSTAQTNHAASVETETGIRKQAEQIASKISEIQQPIEQQMLKIAQARLQWRAARQQVALLQQQHQQNQRLIEWLENRQSMVEHKTLLTDSQTKAAEVDASSGRQNSRLSEATERHVLAINDLKEYSTALDGAQAMLTAIDTERTRLITARDALADVLILVKASENATATIAELDSAIQLQNDSHAIQANVVAQALEAQQVGTKRIMEIESQIDQHKATVAALSQELASAIRRADELQAVVREKENLAASQLQAVIEDRWRQLSAARLRPLSPEQLCWSILRVMGIFDQYVANEVVELDKTTPLPLEPPPTDLQLVERQRLLVRKAIDKLRGNADHFATLYATGAGQSDAFFSTAEQALYMSNGGTIYAWSAAGGTNVTQQVIQAVNPQAAAEIVTLILLDRMPTPEEVELVTQQLSGPDEQRASRAQELVWAILSGSEFRFVH